MKRVHLIPCGFVVVLLLSMLVPHIAAQDTVIPVVAKIPFEFNVGDRQMPAGNYKIWHTISNPHLLTLRNEDEYSVELACTHNLTSPSTAVEGMLIFNRYGEKYFLVEVWWPNDTNGHALSRTGKEKSYMKEFSAGDKKHAREAEKVTIKFPGKAKSNQ